jgi:hypothetical protein
MIAGRGARARAMDELDSSAHPPGSIVMQIADAWSRPQAHPRRSAARVKAEARPDPFGAAPAPRTGLSFEKMIRAR